MDNGKLSCCKTRSTRTSFPLGFFLQPSFSLDDDDSPSCSAPTTKFLSTSDEGEDLRTGKWGALDASLSFLAQRVYILGSSNGFLLCSPDQFERMHYYICNPLTKEWQILPQPSKVYYYQALAFICEGNPASVDGVQYKVVRAGVSNPREFTKTLEIETFSSLTGKWKASTLECALPFSLVVCNKPAFVVDKVIYWKEFRCRMVAYDPIKEHLELMELPGDAQNFIYWSDLLGPSAGKIHYARHDKSHLEVWVLQNCKKGKWTLSHKVTLATIMKENPETGFRVVRNDNICLKAFHPWDSQYLLLAICGMPFWYNLGSGKLNRVRDPLSNRMLCHVYFLYECPWALSASR